MEVLFGGEVDGGRFAGDDAGDRFGVFGRGEFAGVSGGLVAKHGRSMLRPYKRIGTIEQEDDVAFVAEGDFQNFGAVVKNAENAAHGLWVAARPTRSVVTPSVTPTATQ